MSQHLHSRVQTASTSFANYAPSIAGNCDRHNYVTASVSCDSFSTADDDLSSSVGVVTGGRLYGALAHLKRHLEFAGLDLFKVFQIDHLYILSKEILFLPTCVVIVCSAF